MLFRKSFAFIFAILILSVNAKTINENRSNQWTQSLEYKLLCQQVFQNAKNNIDRLDLKNTHSVMLEAQHSTKANLPLAIVTDIDETILLNYEFQIETRKKGGKFSYDLFEQYVTKKTAIAIPGSIKYYQYLASKGIKIIYISNRHISSKDKTFEHLKELGYPIDNKNDLLLKNEKPEWGSSKSSRRFYVGNKYKVIQVFGDNLNDFSETKKQVLQHKHKFGVSWFLIPNSVYGTWLTK